MKYYKINGEQCTKKEKTDELKFIKRNILDASRKLVNSNEFNFCQIDALLFCIENYLVKIEQTLKVVKKREAA